MKRYLFCRIPKKCVRKFWSNCIPDSSKQDLIRVNVFITSASVLRRTFSSSDCQSTEEEFIVVVIVDRIECRMLNDISMKKVKVAFKKTISFTNTVEVEQCHLYSV